MRDVAIDYGLKIKDSTPRFRDSGWSFTPVQLSMGFPKRHVWIDEKKLVDALGWTMTEFIHSGCHRDAIMK
jgi:hypothetical protein